MSSGTTLVDKKLFKDAISIFAKYDSAALSFTDCTSFALCRNFDIHRDFAFDKHFTMMGISLCLK